ncbi:MAG: hypothetical protein GY945_02240, partial [Rhodobacteraceae bacterium]|nr:hypothetical protein [Paracoccaceae bacterium]
MRAGTGAAEFTITRVRSPFRCATIYVIVPACPASQRNGTVTPSARTFLWVPSVGQITLTVRVTSEPAAGRVAATGTGAGAGFGNIIGAEAETGAGLETIAGAGFEAGAAVGVATGLEGAVA